MIRIATGEVIEVLSRILVNRGFGASQAALSATLLADANCDGVLSHGLDKFSSYISMIDEGDINPAAQPERIWRNAALERWNGNRGPLPIGFWKGSGLSILLDLMAALLSGGKAAFDISRDSGKDTGVSQVFIVFSAPEYPGLADRVVASLQADSGTEARYPGGKA